MGIPVMILGESGSGKSTSLRNFEEGEIKVLNVANKPLPFKKKLDKVNNATYEVIGKELVENKYKTYVIDDSQYLLVNDFFDKIKDNGYNKFTEIAIRFRNLLQYIITKMPDDTIVYFLHHTDRSEDGRIKAKTIGKMLDEKLTLEGLFSIVLLCTTDGNNHKFITQSDGYTPAKSPMEMFDKEIDNDLKFVDTTIREYYDIQEEKEEEK